MSKKIEERLNKLEKKTTNLSGMIKNNTPITVNNDNGQIKLNLKNSGNIIFKKKNNSLNIQYNQEIKSRDVIEDLQFDNFVEINVLDYVFFSDNYFYSIIYDNKYELIDNILKYIPNNLNNNWFIIIKSITYDIGELTGEWYQEQIGNNSTTLNTIEDFNIYYINVICNKKNNIYDKQLMIPNNIKLEIINKEIKLPYICNNYHIYYNTNYFKNIENCTFYYINNQGIKIIITNIILIPFEL